MEEMERMANSRRKTRRERTRNNQFWWWALLIPLLLAAGWYFFVQSDKYTSSVVIEHIHSLGYAGDGSELVVAAHTGLRVFRDGVWSIPSGVPRDYMGYTPVDEGFYSSGHPAPGTLEINPLGLVKSTDKGETLIQLGFEGESDFHLMAVGFYSHAIYILNSGTNSRLGPGIHYSLDDGTTWHQSALNGIVAAQPYQIAVHPTAPEIVAIATEGGLFLSTDFGDSFESIGEAVPVPAVTFDLRGETMLFGAQDLRQYTLATGTLAELNAPPIGSSEIIQYLASHPVSAESIVLGTSELSIYVTDDSGESWVQIADQGQGINQ
jgi:hypothetical protein